MSSRIKRRSRSPKQTASFKLTLRQEQANRLLAGPQRHTLLVGGSRSGKTFVLCRAVLIRALKAPGSRHAILRRAAKAARASIGQDTLPKVARLCLPGLRLHWRGQDGVFVLANGSEIWLGGLDTGDRAEKILGQEFATLYFNECSQLAYGSVTLARTRLAQSIRCPDGTILRQRAYYDLNPTGKRHWTYRMFVAAKDPNYAWLAMNPADNAENLKPDYLAELATLPERSRRRFLDGEYQEDIDGALWTIERFEAHRRRNGDHPDLVRVAVAIDPSGTSGDSGDAVGIVVAGLGSDGRGYVLEDLTCRVSPEAWARRAVGAYHRHRADCLLAERNFGGDMVRAVLRAVDATVPIRTVTASRGKAVRAEPIAALYEQGRVAHVGDGLSELEDEMLSFSTSGYQGAGSPNRADALVWALTWLMQPEQVFAGPLVLTRKREGLI